MFVEFGAFGSEFGESRIDRKPRITTSGRTERHRRKTDRHMNRKQGSADSGAQAVPGAAGRVWFFMQVFYIAGGGLFSV